MLEAGKFIAQLTGQSEDTKSGIVIYETQSGALCAALPCRVIEGPRQGETIKHTMTLAKKDGTIQQRTIDTLKDVFGWDGTDPFQLMDQDLSEKQFELDIEMEQGVNKDGSLKFDDQGQAVFYPKVKWLNPVGGNMAIPKAADRRSVLAKYGSKFRALSGGAPAKPATPPSAKPPTAKAAPPAVRTGPTATMEQAWEDCCKANPEEEKASAAWVEKMTELFPGKTNTDLTPQDWGKLRSAFDYVPM